MIISQSLKDNINKLSEVDLQELFNYIGERMNLKSLSSGLNNQFKESRFADGQKCPYCNSDKVVKNGTRKNRQRYLCKECSKSFNDLTMSALSNTKLPLETWIEYAKGIIIGLSIRKNAKAVDVCVKTSFYMRHKLLDCVREFLGTGDVDGVVEMDECYIAESFKGNHKKSGFIMPRLPRKRGKQVKKRGISNEQVCVASAIDRHGNIILEPVCLGRVTTNNLENLYKNHIGGDSIICTDSHKSYIQFAKDLHLDHKRIPRGKHKEGIYHINHINNLHSGLKVWMYRFKGVSTKFIDNYMAWYKWLKMFDDDKDIIRTKNILIHSIIPFVNTTIKLYKERAISFE